MKNKDKFIYTFIVIVLCWYIIAIVCGPYFSLVGGFITNIRNALGVFKYEKIIKSLINTFSLSFLVCLLVNIISLFQVFINKVFKIRFQKFFNFCFSMPLFYNGILLVMGYKYLYSYSGVITKLLLYVFPNMNAHWFEGGFAVLLVNIFSMNMFHYYFVSDAINSIDNSLIESAKSLKTSNRQILKKIIIPLILPSVLISSLFVFINSVASNAAPTFLGGKDFYMISQSIKTFNSSGYVDISTILSFFLGMFSIIILLVIEYISNRKKRYSLNHVTKRFKKIEIKNKYTKLIVTILGFILSIIYLLPIIITIIYSFTNIDTIYFKLFPQVFTLSNYARVFTQGNIIEPLFNSLKLSFMAFLVALIISLIVIILTYTIKKRWTKILHNFIVMSWTLPAIVIAMGFQKLYSTSNILGLNLIEMGGDNIIIFAYSILIVNIIIQAMKSNLKNVSYNYYESSISLGIGRIKSFIKVILPLLIPTIFSLISICIVSLISEFTISENLYSYSNKPISIVYRSEFSNSTPYQLANIMVFSAIIFVFSILLNKIITIFKNKFNMT